MEKITNGQHEFELVDCVPSGYKIWNIGRNMIEGYLPLVQTGGYDGCQVVGIKKAIKVDKAQTILSAVGYGPCTVTEMEKYIEKNASRWPSACIKMSAALPIMKQIKGL